ncbi:MAG: baseplate J/gp47 family protein [Clostridia bacterium]|nr:baseplate J/gp47 family protein [Clostridia bacterium]
MQTYDEILKRMTEKYTELSGVVPDESSDIGIRLRVLAGEVYSNLVNTEWLRRQMFVSTAEGEYLDMHAEERGITRRDATVSRGEVTFSVNEPATRNINIPKGTVVADVTSLLRFETTADAVLSAGALSVSVTAQSLDKGRKYNVIKNRICLMVTPPAGIDAVINSEAFSGGCNKESDESLRARVENSIRFPQNGANCAYYEAKAQSIKGVSSAAAVPRARGVGTVDVYIAAEGSVASNEALRSVQELLSAEREVNVDVLVKKASPATVDFYLEIDVNEGYAYSDVRRRVIDNVTDYISGQGVGSEVLMCDISECVYHTEGVKSLSFVPQVNSDFVADKSLFPVAGIINVTRRV